MQGMKFCPLCFCELKPFRNETELHIACKLAFDSLFQNFGEIVHHNNNSVHSVAGARAKAMGVRKSMPDFQIFRFDPYRKSFFIEIKHGKGSMSKEQKERKAMLEAAGHAVYIATSVLQLALICRKELTPSASV